MGVGDLFRERREWKKECLAFVGVSEWLVALSVSKVVVDIAGR